MMCMLANEVYVSKYSTDMMDNGVIEASSWVGVRQQDILPH